ncbi:MAG: hypothetical protein Q7I92_14065, partial [Humidesulfovibrio sp.]|nr:hypothetical protein [Humidesulfovibrio sp.]
KAEEAKRRKAEAAARRELETAAKHEKEATAAQAKAQAHAPAPAPTPVSSPAPALAPAPAPSIAPAASPAPAAQTAPQPAQVAPAKADAATGQPYFSVPYSMRAPENKSVLGLPSGSTATLPPVASQTALPPAAAPGKPLPAAKPMSAVVGGKLPQGVTEKPILQDKHGAVQPSQTPPTSPDTAPPDQAAHALPAPVQMAPVRMAPVDVQPEKGKSDVRFRADKITPEQSRLAEVVSGTAAFPKASATAASAPAKVAPPQGQSQGQGARPWELRQQVQKTVPPIGGSANASDHGQPKEDAKDAHAAPGKAGGKDKPEEPHTEQQLKDKLLQAQSSMSSGQWPQAITALQELLREPNLKGDLREDVLYSLGDAYMQGYKDSMVGNYDKIAGAQQTAMNANQKSRRVPRALLNLGLLNLKVGNLKEAQAYFNIIKRKYKLDQSASMVPFSLGEYYRNKGDLKKAADQY